LNTALKLERLGTVAALGMELLETARRLYYIYHIVKFDRRGVIEALVASGNIKYQELSRSRK